MNLGVKGSHLCEGWETHRPSPSQTRGQLVITEDKHLIGRTQARISVTREYPRAEGDPYYPVPRAENQKQFKRYEALANATEDVTFVGELATCRYYNMDQIIGQALATFRRAFAERAPERVAKVT